MASKQRAEKNKTPHELPERVLWELDVFNELNMPLGSRPSPNAEAGMSMDLDAPLAVFRARRVVEVYCSALEAGRASDSRLGKYMQQAMQRAVQVEHGPRELARLFGLGRSQRGVTAAMQVLDTFATVVGKEGAADPAVIGHVLAALRASLASKKGILAKELGLQRLRAGNPGGRSMKRQLSPEDKEEIFQRYMLMTGATQTQRGANEKAKADASATADATALPASKPAPAVPPATSRSNVLKPGIAINLLADEYLVTTRTIELCLPRGMEREAGLSDLEGPIGETQ